MQLTIMETGATVNGDAVAGTVTASLRVDVTSVPTGTAMAVELEPTELRNCATGALAPLLSPVQPAVGVNV